MGKYPHCKQWVPVRLLIWRLSPGCPVAPGPLAPEQRWKRKICPASCRPRGCARLSDSKQTAKPAASQAVPSILASRWPGGLLGTARAWVTGHASRTRGEPRPLVSGPGIAGLLAKWKDLWTGSQAGVLVPSPSSPYQFIV